MKSDSILKSTSDEQKWTKQIDELLDTEAIDCDIAASIFQVPTSLSSSKPEAYTPQMIALGPYHHFTPNLYAMERFKLAAVKRAQSHLNLNFSDLVARFVSLEASIRSCYNKYVDLDRDTLGYVVAIDGLFLLDFLESLAGKRSRNVDLVCPVFDSAGRRLGRDAMVRDVLMLENQLPMIVLQEVFVSLYNSENVVDVDADADADQLATILVDFCKKLCPFTLKDDYPLYKVTSHAHLLDLLYCMIFPKFEPPMAPSTRILGISSSIIQPIKAVHSIISKAPQMTSLIQTTFTDEKTMPLAEIIMFPSASSLSKAGVKFHPTVWSATTCIHFDKQHHTLYLPIVHLGLNSEVVMRNLVAYEASVMSNTLAFTRYTEFMNWLIDTADDVKLLREKKIVMNRLKNDGEAAEVFNGMTKSIGLTEESDLDSTIESINKYYEGRWRIKMSKFMMKYVFASWKMLTLIAGVLSLLLMILQSVCSVYSCRRVFNMSEIYTPNIGLLSSM